MNRFKLLFNRLHLTGVPSALLPALLSQLLLPLLLAGLLLLCSSEASAQRFAVKTNALYWLTTTPNLAAEVALGRHFSLQMGAGYNGWKFTEGRTLKHLMLTPEARYWFSSPMERHYLGLYGQYATFNLRNLPLLATNELAYRGRLYGGGLAYGYQWALGKHFGIEVSVGVGYLYLDYSKFHYTECCAERVSDHRRTYIGPTRAALNLIYLIR